MPRTGASAGISPVALALPFTPRSAAVARRQLTDWLTRLEQPAPVLDDSRLVLSELIGNAVRHARPLPDGTMRVAWDRVDDGASGTGVVISVSDGGGETQPHLVEGYEADRFGRGLTIIGQVADRWWYEADAARGTTHAVIALD